MENMLIGLRVNTSIAKNNLKEKVKRTFEEQRGDISMKVLWIALGLIIAVAVFYPQLKDFAETIMKSLDTWYSSTMEDKIFPTTP